MQPWLATLHSRILIKRSWARRIVAARTVPARDAARLATAVGELRAQGSRVTKARVAILEVLSTTEAHQSADDVARAVGEIAPGVHRATVYRTLDSLVSAGLVAHTHLGHGTAVYQLTIAPHAHLQCQRCGLVIDVPQSNLRAVGKRLLDDFGFTLDPGHSALLGVCATCQAIAGNEKRQA